MKLHEHDAPLHLFAHTRRSRHITQDFTVQHFLTRKKSSRIGEGTTNKVVAEARSQPVRYEGVVGIGIVVFVVQYDIAVKNRV